MITLTCSEWLAKAEAHRERMDRYIVPHLERRTQGTPHAVIDFLFEYYPYSPGKLRAWHPGLGVSLEGPVLEEHKRTPYRETDGYWSAGVEHDSAARIEPRLDLVLRLLRGTAERSAQLNCFGLHEWAMVYRTDDIRHSRVPLRVSPEVISETVDHMGLRCTHIDAYRFFTESAAPLNAHVPTRESQPDLEQPGCIHATMDLYKYAMWFQAWVGSDLVADCFDLAFTARSLDMAASPYDVLEFGIAPVQVETSEGRAEYARMQRLLMDEAQPLRLRLIDALVALRAALQHEVPVEVG